MTSNTLNHALLHQIGAKIAAARQFRGEKGNTVAKAVGISQAVISQVESGSYPSLKVTTLLSLSDYLNIPLSELLS